MAVAGRSWNWKVICSPWFKLAAAQHLVGQEAQGRISGVQSYGFFVEVGETRVEGLVHVSSLNDDWYEYRSRQNRLVGRKIGVFTSSVIRCG